MGGLDGLVLNVGIGAGMGMQGTTPEQWDAVFAVNVRSHFLLAAAALEVMPEGGAIVFISSIAGLTPGQPHPGLRRLEGGPHGPLPPGRRRRGPQGDPCQRRRARSDRHAARAPRHRGPPVTRQGARAARAAGHRVGGRRAGRLPPQRRRQLHHQPAPRRRRRPHRSTRLVLGGRFDSGGMGGDDRSGVVTDVGATASHRVVSHGAIGRFEGWPAVDARPGESAHRRPRSSRRSTQVEDQHALVDAIGIRRTVALDVFEHSRGLEGREHLGRHRADRGERAAPWCRSRRTGP